jgi:hypothetical protein
MMGEESISPTIYEQPLRKCLSPQQVQTFKKSTKKLLVKLAKDAQICQIWAHILDKFSLAVWGRMLVKFNVRMLVKLNNRMLMKFNGRMVKFNSRMLVKFNGEIGNLLVGEKNLVKLTRRGDETTLKWNCHLFSSLLFALNLITEIVAFQL